MHLVLSIQFFCQKLSKLHGIADSRYAPLQLAHNLDNHLQLNLMDTYQSAEETPRCLQHKSPPPHSGRPLARLRHERIDSHPHRTTTPNDNNLQTTSKCLRSHLPSATRHSSHRHSGLHPTSMTATQDRTSWRSLVRDATRPTTQAT